MLDLQRFSLPPTMSLRWNLVSRPLRSSFGISRGVKSYATSLAVELSHQGQIGKGESVPYARYGESLREVRLRMQALGAGDRFEADACLAKLGGGCIREAIDAARWDFLCKREGVRIDELLDLPLPERIATCYTVSLSDPAAMASQAQKLRDFGTLKLKLAGDSLDLARIEAVAAQRPDARLVADANEAWPSEQWPLLGEQAAEAGLSLLEQPFLAGRDSALAKSARPLPCFADESVHEIDALAQLCDRYDGVNIKLGKCGGLDRGLAMLARAKELGLSVMVGSMVGSSRSIAPALLLAAQADEVDLDAHLWLTHDVDEPLRMHKDEILCNWSPQLWG